MTGVTLRIFCSHAKDSNLFRLHFFWPKWLFFTYLRCTLRRIYNHFRHFINFYMQFKLFVIFANLRQFPEFLKIFYIYKFYKNVVGIFEM